jgi:hypothetical protein
MKHAIDMKWCLPSEKAHDRRSHGCEQILLHFSPKAALVNKPSGYGKLSVQMRYAMDMSWCLPSSHRMEAAAPLQKANSMHGVP